MRNEKHTEAHVGQRVGDVSEFLSFKCLGFNARTFKEPTGKNSRNSRTNI